MCIIENTWFSVYMSILNTAFFLKNKNSTIDIDDLYRFNDSRQLAFHKNTNFLVISSLKMLRLLRFILTSFLILGGVLLCYLLGECLLLSLMDSINSYNVGIKNSITTSMRLQVNAANSKNVNVQYNYLRVLNK